MTRTFEEINIGWEIDSLERAISDLEVEEFCALSGMPSPNRFVSREVARQQGLTDVIVPGQMPIVYMYQYLSRWIPGAQLKTLDVVFRQFTPHNSPLRLSAVVTDTSVQDGRGVVEVDLKVDNSEGVRMMGARLVLLMSLNGNGE